MTHGAVATCALVPIACAAKPAPAAGSRGYFTAIPTPVCDASADRDFVMRERADAAPRECTISGQVSFERDVHPILESNCSGEVCHNDTWASENAYSLLVRRRASECCDGRELIAPGDPNDSYIVQKLLGASLCYGVKMPASGAITEQQIATVAAWICEGAPDN